MPNRKINFSIIFAIIFFTAICIYATLYNPANAVSLSNGIADYSNLSFTDEDKYSINELFYISQDFKKTNFSSYKLKVILPENVKNLAIRIPSVHSEMQFFINGKLFYSRDNTNINILPCPRIIFFRAEKPELDINMYVKNSAFSDRLSFLNPANTNDLIIGNPQAILTSQKESDISNMLIIIACFLCFFYHIISINYKKTIKSHIYLSIFCLTVAVCLFCNSQVTIHYFLPNLPLSVYFKTYVVFFFIKLIALLGYIREEIYSTIKAPIHYYIFLVLIAFLTVITIFLEFDKVIYLYPILYIIAAIVFVICLYNVSTYSFKTKTNKSYIIIGLIAILAGFYTEYLYIWGSNSYFSYFSICQFFFILIQTFNISKQYNETLKHIKLLSPQLKDSLDQLQNNPSTYIGTHITPNFLFETLNSIEKYIDYDYEKVDMLIQSLAKYLRQALDFSANPSAYSMKKEIDNCQAYSSLVTEQHHEIKFYFDIAENIHDTLIPQQSILSFIENSVDHAFAGILHPTVNVKVSEIYIQKREYINIEISDNGIGMTENEIEHALSTPSQSFNICIYYINNQLISNFDSSLSISSKARKGTVISFVVPVVEVESYE